MEESQVDAPQGFDSFPDDVREDVEGLIWLGYIEDTFSFCGHTFTIATMRGEEELLAALVCQEYAETLGQTKAWVWSQVGVALIAIDGDEAFCPPVGPNKKDTARARFQYVTENWFWPTAEFVYAKYVDLLERQQQAIEAVESLSSGSRPFSLASADFSTERAASTPELGEDIKELLDPEEPTPSNDDS